MPTGGRRPATPSEQKATVWFLGGGSGAAAASRHVFGMQRRTRDAPIPSAHARLEATPRSRPSAVMWSWCGDDEVSSLAGQALSPRTCCQLLVEARWV